MGTSVEKLSAELAFKANVDAVSRDYVCKPHIGAWWSCWSLSTRELSLLRCAEVIGARQTHTRPFCVPRRRVSYHSGC